jgi:hypothetical protein
LDEQSIGSAENRLREEKTEALRKVLERRAHPEDHAIAVAAATLLDKGRLHFNVSPTGGYFSVEGAQMVDDFDYLVRETSDPYRRSILLMLLAGRLGIRTAEDKQDLLFELTPSGKRTLNDDETARHNRAVQAVADYFGAPCNHINCDDADLYLGDLSVEVGVVDHRPEPFFIQNVSADLLVIAAVSDTAVELVGWLDRRLAQQAVDAGAAAVNPEILWPISDLEQRIQRRIAPPDLLSD